MMIGKKLSTLPMPVKTPSVTSPVRIGLTLALSIAFFVMSVRLEIPASNRFCRLPPIRSKVSQKISPMMRMNIGMAVNLPVRMRSILTLRRCSRLSAGFVTVREQTLWM